jgi:ATP-dependent RNA helicase SUPV3L1/SUV3
VTSSSSPLQNDTQTLDALTGGAFSAPTSGERAARLREWMATEPSVESMQEVFREMSARDKGAAKALREKLDELRRAKAQDSLALEWAHKGEALRDAPRINLADAMAWQRDAAKAGAPLSREPLSTLKNQLAERVKGIEDLQHRAQVQREASMMMAQRIEMLSTKPWEEAQSQRDTLAADLQRLQADGQTLTTDANWACVDARFPPMLQASGQQLTAVWEAFDAALKHTVLAASDPALDLPAVPAWADQLRAARTGTPVAVAPAKPRIDPAQRAQAQAAVQAVLAVLEQELAQGHGKASAGAAAAVRQALREQGRWLDEKFEHHAQGVLAAASELEGWQRWRADQIRQDLVARAEALFKKVVEKVPAANPGKAESAPSKAAPVASDDAAAAGTPVADSASDEAALTQASVAEVPDTHATPSELTTAEPTVAETPTAEAIAAQVPAAVTPAVASKPVAPKERITWVPVMGGRKMQEALRQLREEWKQTDQGGLPNHGLWKRFDQACNRAHKVVETWLDKVRAESAEHRAHRLALIDELKAWAAAHAAGPDWKAVNRALYQFSDRWREAGHVSEKVFNEVQPLWKSAFHDAQAPLAAVQKASLAQRHALIEEAKVLSAEPHLRIDAVKSLQQRWQQESQVVALDRRQEQKLWDAFRKPIDEAFQRKTQQREQAAAAHSALDQAVIQAAKALDTATQRGDAAQIRSAMQALEQATRGQAAAAAASLAAQASASAAVASRPDTSAPAGDAPAPATSVDATTAAADVLPTPSGAVAETPPSATPEAAATDGAAVASEAHTEGASVTESDAGESSAASAPDHAPASVQDASVAATPSPTVAKKPVVAVRGDDRPGQKRTEPAASRDGRGARAGDRGRPGGPGGRDARDARAPRDGARGFDRREGREGRDGFEPRGPRLGDTAFRAQRNALEQAQQTLRKLAAQAHGEALTQLLGAWEQRQAEQVPPLKELGSRLQAPQRQAWVQAVSQAPSGDATDALLRLEIAADVPTPAAHVPARRALQLQMLTRRNDPAPAQTWTQDAARVLGASYDADQARRLQNALKGLLKTS